MANTSLASDSAYNQIYFNNGNTYRIAIGFATSNVTTLAEVLLTENPLLSSVASYSAINGLWLFNGNHSGTALSSSYTANYCALIGRNSSLADLFLLAVNPLAQVIGAGSSLTTQFRIQVKSENV